MATVNAGLGQPIGEVPALVRHDAEKSFAGAGDHDAREVNDEKAESVLSSEHKQQGVQQVEAITTVWSRELLIVMFVL